eukprot:TRINITY_DN5376_c0_g1_i1.p1 TRINITY_DN5376_c0_g1~~TRINITY_DN5376_c0_g1_i1.p1  ORF type:complete len:350 (+),score=97.24 TRINITY_DN5376_c0_g1_i1:34-1050(+)
MSQGKVTDITSAQQFKEVITSAGASSLVICDFWATWCEPCTQLNQVFSQLAEQNSQATFLKIEAESVPELSEKFEVKAVPFFLFLQNSKSGVKVVDSLEGADAPELVKKVKAHVSALSVNPSTGSDQGKSTSDLNSRLSKLINYAPVMLFMKGKPEEPECGFSSKIVAILKKNNIKFGSFNILTDEEVRQGLKSFSNWPTYPQLYISGKLVGGLDIVKELDEEGELKNMIPPEAAAGSLEDRLKKLIAKENVMVFMKGSPAEPECGFSAKLVEILNKTGVKYGTFDILKDEEVRQGLKTFSNWPTYPQVYVSSKLVGGLDIIKELDEDGSLVSTLEGK